MGRMLALCPVLFFLLLPHTAQGKVINWSIRPANAGMLKLDLGQDGKHSDRDWEAAELRGFDGRLPSGPQSFRITRNAGTLVCTGVSQREQAKGTCEFDRDKPYFEGLTSRNVRIESDIQAWELAQFDVRLELIDELRRQGYRAPSAAQLVSAGIFKVDTTFLRELDQIGFRSRSIDDLISLRANQVAPAFIRDARAARPRSNLDARALIGMRYSAASPGR